MEFQCCQCSIEFNQTDHSPLVLPSCGHSICLSCVNQYTSGEQSLVCKEDGIQCNVPRDIKCFPHNQSIIALLKKRRSSGRCITTIQTPDEQQQQIHNQTKDVSDFSSEKGLSHSQSQEALPKTSLCKLHQKELELVCQEDGQYICVNCALFGPHKFHNYLPIEQYLKQIELAVQQISNVYKQIQIERNSQEQFKQLLVLGLNQQQNCLKSLIELQFDDLIKSIGDIKLQVLHKVELNYQNSIEHHSNKLDSEFISLQIEADKWLNQANIQLSLLLEDSQEQKNLKFDDQIVKQGEILISQFDKIKEQIKIKIEQTYNQLDVQVPIQIIINYITKMMGLNKTKSEVIKQEFIQPLESILEEKDPIKKIDQSDFLLDDRQLQEEIFQQYEQHKPLQIDVAKGKRYSGIFSQSQQPTQPTSPSQDMTKSTNFTSNQNQPIKFKERSMTLSHHELLDVSQILVQKQSKISNNNQNSNSKSQKKFTNNQKMNDKLSNTFSIIHQDKSEIIDLSSIDFNDQIIQILGDYLKGTQTVKVLKLSKCKLTDDLLYKLVLNITQTKINTLHLQQNILTEKCLDNILTHLRQNGQTQLKSIYVNQNNFTAAKAKKKIDELKKFGIQISL
ncbi:unnamed protein product (macronuclear) [Paramecium tetraurelia]|uniref:B box-type domain-containing protein n=1 Tax=Paramecium tetraurelia TaxID=5888 RepID=A0DPS7_PARTE|nr:uncharacterized protein GSPATT00019226001 [Paramecium tetraurelia]CAK85044.1 unnamed protein product [Paramecium tetraurelia]|eukprot:XP_001452441.1 hypothetical protein (macronuclear) [Paramecium tetraurelia strain d4-2]